MAGTKNTPGNTRTQLPTDRHGTDQQKPSFKG